MDIGNLSEREILALQYSLLEEMKQKKTSDEITFSVENSYDVDEFIKQKFKDDDGKEENTSQRLNRLRWFESGCIPYKDFAEQYGLIYQSIKNIASQFNWTDILDKAMDIGFIPKYNEFIDDSPVKRDSKEYNRFRESVLKRDKVCQCCGSNEDLEVHHLFPFKSYNSLGADTKNGVALCKECHTQYHSQYGTKKNNNPVTFAQFLRDYGMSPQTKLPDNVFDTYKGLALRLIEKLQDDYAGDCPVNVLTSELGEQLDLLEEQSNLLITTLKQKGLIYEPTTGYVKVVE